MSHENEIHITTSRRDPFTVMVGEGQAVYFANGKSEAVTAEIGQFIVDSGQVPDANLRKPSGVVSTEPVITEDRYDIMEP